VPCIHFEGLTTRAFPKDSHHVQTLLQYHYRFGIDESTGESPAMDVASILDGPRSPHIRELWCFAVDRSMWDHRPLCTLTVAQKTS
jgi:hypothetical protein